MRNNPLRADHPDSSAVDSQHAHVWDNSVLIDLRTHWQWQDVTDETNIARQLTLTSNPQLVIFVPLHKIDVMHSSVPGGTK